MNRITIEQLELLHRKFLIMQAAVDALAHRLEEYNPDDEIAAGATWSIIELREQIQKIEP